MKLLLSLEDPIRTTRGEAVRVLTQALKESLFLGGRERTEEYAALALDLADALVTRCQPAGQRQDSVSDQLRDLMPIANREGMYDAANFIRRYLERVTFDWPTGTRVRHTWSSLPLRGTIIGYADDDGCYIVRWDTGREGRVDPSRLSRVR